MLLGLAVFPTMAVPSEVAAACRALSAWAEASEQLETALRFAESAALADVDDPEHCAIAGYLSFRLADYNRAAAWYHRTVAIARTRMRKNARNQHIESRLRRHSLRWYIRGHLRMGILYFQLGRHDLARPHYLLAERTALRRKKFSLAAQANHDLLTLESDVGTYADGEAYAARALEMYRVRHPRVPHLAHDYAYLLVRNGFYSHALFLLERLSPDLFEPRYQVIYWGTLARAAAGAGNRREYESAAYAVLQIADASEENAATSIVHVAEGARTFGEWDYSEWLAGRALEIGLKRKEATAIQLAETLLDALAERAPALPEAAPPAGARIAELSRLFIRRVGRQAAPERLSGTALSSSVPAELSYVAGIGQGTITRPPDPIDPPLRSSS
jgi:tetratricopeptide (TPR) repeat protein